MTLKHFPWVYYMIICHVGPPWGHSGTHGNPKMAQNCTEMAQMAQNYHAGPNGPLNFQFSIFQGQFLCFPYIFTLYFVAMDVYALITILWKNCYFIEINRHFGTGGLPQSTSELCRPGKKLVTLVKSVKNSNSSDNIARLSEKAKLAPCITF